MLEKKDTLSSIKTYCMWGLYNIEKLKLKQYDDDFIQERINVELLNVYDDILSIIEEQCSCIPNKKELNKIEKYYEKRKENKNGTKS